MNKKIFKIVSLTLALILCVMCVSVSAEQTQPQIRLFGNETTPAKPGEEIKLYAKLTDLSEMAGLDISVSGGTGFAFTGVEVDNITLVSGTNYTLSNTEIHIVDIFNIFDKPVLDSAYIEVDAKIADTAVAGDYTVTFSGVLAAKDGKTKLNEGALATAVVAVREAEKTANVGTLTADEGMFIPYGSVYDTDGEFTDKLSDGSFSVSANTKYTQFRFGKSGITTFGVSFAEDNTAVQFGSYADDKSGKTYGTMCMIGDWDSFKEYYRYAKGYSETELVKMVSDRYDTVMAENPDATHVIMKCNKTMMYGIDDEFVDFNPVLKTTEIAVYKVAQTKYMWGKEHATDLQYALRVRGTEQGTQYAAVGYFIEDNEVTLSTEIKSAEVE